MGDGRGRRYFNTTNTGKDNHFQVLLTKSTNSGQSFGAPVKVANGNSQFFGDYAGVTAVSGSHPLLSDTRNPDALLCPGTATPSTPPAVCTFAQPNGLIANDQQIYTRTMPAS